jgi:hypothetical protein
MGGRIIFGQLSCSADVQSSPEQFVRLNINDGITAIPDCDNEPGKSCPLADFAAWTKREGEKWEMSESSMSWTRMRLRKLRSFSRSADCSLVWVLLRHWSLSLVQASVQLIIVLFHESYMSCLGIYIAKWSGKRTLRISNGDVWLSHVSYAQHVVERGVTAWWVV